MAEPRWTTLLRRLEHRATPIIALLLIGLVFFLGIRSERTGFVDEVLDPNLKRITHPVLNAFRGRPPAVTKLTLQMGEAEKDSLTAMQDNALTHGWMDIQDDAWLPAQATVGDLKAIAAVRLQAGPVARDLVPRWPLVVGLDHADTTTGMRFFDLNPVNDSKPIHGALFRRALEDMGIPVLTNEVIELRLNDRDMGLYTQEGKADSTQLAHWGRGNGPVLRFDDVLHKHALRGTSSLSFPIDAPVRAEWLSAPIQASRIQGGRAVLASGIADRKAVEALERFRAGSSMASEVFDAEFLAKFLALCDVMGAQETARWWNLRFLADTVTGKLIVLPQRTIAGSPITGIIARHTDAPLTFPSTANSLTGRFLADRVIYAAYIQWLDKLSDVTWL
ncbi:MAG: hypothetical protein WEC15_08140, partial [Flavobacteriales bacterium]